MYDLRLAIRGLRRTPGFTLVAVLTLALAVGANSAIFSLIDGVLLQPLPYPEPDRLVRIYNLPPEEGLTPYPGSFSPQDFQDFAAGATTFQQLATFLGDETVAFSDGAEPQELPAAYVSGNFFSTLGVAATLGRTLTPADDVVGANRFAVVSEGFWRRQLGGDAGIIDRPVRMAGETFTLVGVVPETVDYPGAEVDVWLPLTLITDNDIPHMRGLRWVSVVGRLAPGATAEAAAAETNTILRRLESEYPESNDGWGRGQIESLHESIVGQARPALLALLGTVGLLLLIACANLANLVIARAITRSRETATRVAIGATRRHLVRGVLSEGLVLGIAGGTIGFLLASQLVPGILALSGEWLPRAAEIQPDARVGLLTVLLGAATAVAFSLVPAVRAAGTNPQRALREGGRGGIGSRHGGRGRSLLVVAQTALALVLLAGAGLMVRSLWNLSRIDPGFAAQNVLVVGITMEGSPETQELRQGQRAEIVRRVGELPGVLVVGGAESVPLEGIGEPYTFKIPELGPDGPDVTPEAGTFIVHRDYFRALGIPFISGETFRPADVPDPPLDVVINRSLAERYFGDQEPIGRTLALGEMGFRIAGVVADVRATAITEAPVPAAYVSTDVFQRSSFHLLIRTNADPMQLSGAVRETIWDVDPQQPIARITTMEGVVGAANAQPRFLTTLLTAFGALALLLAGLGVYGVTAFAVGQRTSEIGLRIALGATRAAVLRTVAGRTMALAAIGLLLGLPTSLLLTRALGGLLYGVTPNDPAAFFAAVGVLLLVSLAAIQIPARRATRVDPVVALRSE